MKTLKLMAASAAACALAIGAPAYAQQGQNNDVTDTNNGAVVVNDLLDVYLQAQDNSQDNDTLTVGDVGSATAQQTNDNEEKTNNNKKRKKKKRRNKTKRKKTKTKEEDKL